MAPRRPPANSAKRRAAPPNPSPPLSAADESLPLLLPARRGDLRLFKSMVRDLDKGRGRPTEVVEVAKHQGVGALHMAAAHGRLRVCRYLVEELGVDVDAVDDGGQTPLLMALIHGSMDTASYLVDNGADPGKADNEGLAPLHHAAAAGDRKMVELLLAKGAPVDPNFFGGTPLYLAAMEGHDETVQILLENNADCNIPGVSTPLLGSIIASSVNCVKLLVEAGADVNDGLIAPLSVAAEIKGFTACLKLLLEAGADPNAPDPFGRFPIELAALNGTREGVEILFPVTSCIPTVHDWSVDGIIRHATVSMKQDADSNVRKIEQLKLLGVESLKRNDYLTAASMYSSELLLAPHGRWTQGFAGCSCVQRNETWLAKGLLPAGRSAHVIEGLRGCMRCFSGCSQVGPMES